jgi:hypothetical protein
VYVCAHVLSLSSLLHTVLPSTTGVAAEEGEVAARAGVVERGEAVGGAKVVVTVAGVAGGATAVDESMARSKRMGPLVGVGVGVAKGVAKGAERGGAKGAVVEVGVVGAATHQRPRMKVGIRRLHPRPSQRDTLFQPLCQHARIFTSDSTFYHAMSRPGVTCWQN